MTLAQSTGIEIDPRATPKKQRWAFLLAVGGLALIVLACVLLPFTKPYGPNDFVGMPFAPPSWDMPFGTDQFGRDVFLRSLAGGQIDLLVAVIGVTIPLTIGTAIGVFSGYRAGTWIDAVIMRIVDAILAFPFTILILALAVILGADVTWGFLPPGLPALFIALFITSWTVYARIARAETLSLRSRDFVVAAEVSGLRKWTIVVRHLVPNVLPATITYALSDAVLLIGVTASLPFLGAGVQPPTAEWGGIIYDGRPYLASAPWVSLGPGLMLIITGVLIRVAGQNLRIVRGDE